jgi:regulator of cell morphogenesis and NO signaling
MTTITRTSTLKELVETNPALTRELERRGLDYCCGGSRTLEQACARLGLDPGEVVDELRLVETDRLAPDWAAMDARQLVDHLEATHHRYLWDEMSRLSALMAKVWSVHGARHPELADIAACLADVCADLEPHLMKEERVLFPMVRELAVARTAPSFPCGSVRKPISVMLREHDHVGDLLSQMRALTSGYVPPRTGARRTRRSSTGSPSSRRYASPRAQGEQRAVPDGGAARRPTHRLNRPFAAGAPRRVRTWIHGASDHRHPRRRRTTRADPRRAGSLRT